MKSTMKRVKAVVLVCALFMGLLYAPGQMNSVEAASKAYMKKLQVKWDVKNNKSVTTTTFYSGGVGKKNVTAKISKLKVTKANKEGYKKLTCTLTVNFPKLTASEVHKIAAKGVVGADFYYAIVDYDTGYSLETKNKFGVTVKAKNKPKAKTYRDKHGCWVTMNDATIKLTITYPEDYKGVCIGFGGYSTLNEKKADQKFWKGKKPYGTTTYYTKNKKNNHFMRVKK